MRGDPCCQVSGYPVPSPQFLCKSETILEITTKKVNTQKHKNAGHGRWRHIQEAGTIERWERERTLSQGGGQDVTADTEGRKTDKRFSWYLGQRKVNQTVFPIRITFVYLLGLWRLSSPLKTEREDSIFCPVVGIVMNLPCNSAFPWHSLKWFWWLRVTSSS